MAFEELAMKAAEKVLTTVVGPMALKKGLDYANTDHGSKVKEGAFKECPIEMFGDKSCILLDKENGKILFLTADTIQSYRCVKEKKRLVGVTYHTYFYYDIIFKDGSESYVRMRRKYRDAMLSYV